MKKGLVIAFALVSGGGFAQEENWRLFKSSEKANDSVYQENSFGLDTTIRKDTIRTIKASNPGTINIHKDPRIAGVTELKKGATVINKPGYRIQLKMSDQKEEVSTIRAQFLKGTTMHKAHMEYVAPNFVLKVGDFYTKQQALEFMYEIKEFFPEALLVRDNIELPKLPDNL